MKSPGKGLTLHNIFYSLGYALGKAESLVDVIAAQAGVEASGDGRGAPAAVAPHDAEHGAGAAIGTAVGATAAGWVLSRLLRPRPVHWPRAILAGITATALSDLATHLEEKDRPVLFPPELEDLPRYAAGVATAAAYASLIYPRLPGSSLTRGLLFGAFEATAGQTGGTFGLLRRLVPDLALPLESLAEIGVPEGGPAARLAFGLGLGLYSRDRK